MEQKKFEIKDEQLNGTIYSLKLAELENLGAEFDSAIQVIADGGFPTNEKFIKGNLSTELAFRLYLNSQAKSEIEKVGGLIASNDDRTGIIDKYKMVFEQYKRVINVFKEVYTKGLIKPVEIDGKLTYDRDFNKNTAKMVATFFVDGAALVEYHDLCKQMYDLRVKIKTIEEKHGMHNHFCLGENTDFSDMFDSTQVMRYAQIDSFFGGKMMGINDCPTSWLHVFGHVFKKDGAPKKEEK